MARIIICPNCNETKEHYAKGLCKACRMRQWREENREQVAASKHRYFEEHREQYRAYARRYRKRNPKKVRASLRRWREGHKEERRIYLGFWREKNPEKVSAYNQSYRQKHYQEDLARKRCYRKDHREKIRAQNSRRRAQRRSLPDTLATDQINQLFEMGRTIYPGEKLHLDHVVPLSKGGGTTRANVHVIPASLNMSKHDKLPGEIYEQLGLMIWGVAVMKGGEDDI